MKRWILPLLFFFLLGALVFNPPLEAGAKLWPPIKAYKTGYFKVSDLHEIFYQLGGNPMGKPVMVLHGTADRVTPFRFGEALSKKFGGPVKFYPMEGAPHVADLTPESWGAIKAFLTEHGVQHASH